MNRTFTSLGKLIPPCLVVIAVITLSSGCTSVGKPDLSYAEFVAEVKADKVTNVTLSRNHAIVNFKKSPNGTDPSELTFQVSIPTTDKEKSDLMDLLHMHHVPCEFAPELCTAGGFCGKATA